MKINNNQQNITFQQNILVRFPARMLKEIPDPAVRNAVLRNRAKKFAVAQGKIDSKNNVGLALFTDEANLLVLVLDKTVKSSNVLKIAFDKLQAQLRMIADMKRSKRFDRFEPDAKQRILGELDNRRLDFDTKLAEEAAKAKTFDYTA